MYREFFGMENIPFSRNVPPEMLYESSAMSEALGRMKYVSKEKLFAVVTADAGCGKSTLVRRLVNELPKEELIVVYAKGNFRCLLCLFRFKVSNYHFSLPANTDCQFDYSICIVTTRLG